MVIVPSPGSIWDYPYLNQVTSMMGLVYGTRSKPEQDLFPSNIRIPEIHVISPLHPLSPFQYFNAFTSWPSIDYIFMRTMSFLFLFSPFLFFMFSSIFLGKNFYDPRKKKKITNRYYYHILPSSQELSRDLFIFFPPSSSPPPPFFSPSFSRIRNSIHLKKQRMSLIRVLGNAVRTFLCTIEYDCEIIDNLE